MIAKEVQKDEFQSNAKSYGSASISSSAMELTYVFRIVSKRVLLLFARSLIYLNCIDMHVKPVITHRFFIFLYLLPFLLICFPSGCGGG